ncbi:MAG: peptide transporter, partial [Muribaculaceae bacterium]|nr:peptide transporter [Muribaculaceae bacterium]
KDPQLCKVRNDRGTLIASGLIAGGALFGVLAAVTIMCGHQVPDNGEEFVPQVLGIVAYAAIICYLYWSAIGSKKK